METINRRSKDMPRYTYFYSKSRERCESVLEDMYSDGEISACEVPLIQKNGNVWCITLPMF